MVPGPYAPLARIVEYDEATGGIRGVYEFPRDEMNKVERQPRDGCAFLEVHEAVDARASRVIDGQIAPLNQG